jgi:hypothetical protein
MWGVPIVVIIQDAKKYLRQKIIMTPVSVLFYRLKKFQIQVGRLVSWLAKIQTPKLLAGTSKNSK